MIRAALLAILLAATLTPAAEAGWTRPVTLAPAGEQNAVAASGPHVVAAWTQQERGALRLRAATRRRDGRFQHTRWLTEPGVRPAGPAAAMRPDGTAVVVWQETVERASAVKLVEIAADGTAGPTIALSGPDHNAEYPVAMAGDNGDVVVAWSEQTAGILALIAPPRTPLPRPAVLSPSGIGAQVGIGADGRAVVTWREGVPPRPSSPYDFSCILRAAERPPGGAFGPAEPMAADRQCSAVPLVGVGRGGETTAVWDRLTLSDNDVITATWRRPGGSFAPQQSLSPSGTASLSGFGLRSFDAHPQGGAAAVWWQRDRRDRVQIALKPPGRRFRKPIEAFRVTGGDPYANFLWRTRGEGVLVWRAIRRRRAQVLSRTVSRRGRLGRIRVASSMAPRYDIDYAEGFPSMARGGRGAIWSVWTRADRKVQVARLRR